MAPRIHTFHVFCVTAVSLDTTVAFSGGGFVVPGV